MVKDNQMLANPSELQPMFLSNYKNIEKNMSFVRKTITSWDRAELLGTTIDKNINFKRHRQNVCHKASSKIKALFRIGNVLNLEQAQVLTEVYISSNFGYCPLIWMFCGKMNDNLITETHYRTLKDIHDTQTRLHE